MSNSKHIDTYDNSYKIYVEEIDNSDYYQTHTEGARVIIEGSETLGFVLQLDTRQVKELINALVDTLNGG